MVIDLFHIGQEEQMSGISPDEMARAEQALDRVRDDTFKIEQALTFSLLFFNFLFN